MDTSRIEGTAPRQNTENAHELDRLVVDHVLFVLTEVKNVLQEARVGEHAALHVLEGVLDEAEGPLLLADTCVGVSRRDRPNGPKLEKETTRDLLSRRRRVSVK